MTAQSKHFTGLRSDGEKLGGTKWNHITVEEMFRLYGIMIHMIIEPHHLGGYEGCFIPT